MVSKTIPQSLNQSFLLEIILWKPDATARKCLLILLPLFVLLISYVDYVTGTSFEFYIFFAIPTVIAGLYLGLRPSLYIVLLSFCVWVATDCLLGRGFNSFISFLFNRSTRAFIFILIICLLIKTKNAVEHEFHSSRYDPLTMLYNRRGFNDIALKILESSKRKSFPISIAYIDLDNFKYVNDKMGHKAGDDLLRYIADCMKKIFRAQDLIARFGGDEFVILLPGLDKDDAKQCIENSRNKLLLELNKHSWPVDLSIGVVSFDSVHWTIDEMLSMADHLMYEVKKSGKGAIRFKCAS